VQISQVSLSSYDDVFTVGVKLFIPSSSYVLVSATCSLVRCFILYTNSCFCWVNREEGSRPVDHSLLLVVAQLLDLLLNIAGGDYTTFKWYLAVQHKILNCYPSNITPVGWRRYSIVTVDQLWLSWGRHTDRSRALSCLLGESLGSFIYVERSEPNIATDVFRFHISRGSFTIGPDLNQSLYSCWKGSFSS
jgi:hypothetical protein